MTKEQIDKLCKVGIRKKFNAVELSQYITRPPYNLSAADASLVYYAFKNLYNGGSITKPVVVYPSCPTLEAPAKRLEKKLWPKKMLRPLVPDLTAEIVVGYTPSKLNRSAVKKYALAISDQKRGGKFKRVAGRFVKQIEAEIENVIREIGGAPDNDDIPGEWDFLNRKQIFAAVAEQLNRAVRKIILRKVRSYPSLGKTLK